jgi:HAE1 family hydrophobic/amphiphilic exporter-1
LEVYKEGDANIVEVARNVKEKVFGTLAQQEFVRQLKIDQEEAKKARLTEADTSKAAQGEGEKKAPEKKDPRRRQAALQEEMRKRAMTDFIAYGLPGEMHIELLTDQSVFIENSFLNHVPTTVIVGLSIPLSIIATFAPMRLFDVSLNIMSLGGLALGIGMLVDNSIVVTESIFRCREEGDGFVDSVVRGTKEVGAAVTASTLTTIAVFFPMVFVEGVAGQIFGDLGLTVVFSLLASLGVALFFIPMLASRQFKIKSITALQDSPGRFFKKFECFSEFMASIKTFGRRFSKASLAKKVLLILAAAFWAMWIIFRLLFHLVLEIFSKIFTLIFILTGLIVRLTGLLWQHLLSKIARLVVRIFDKGYNVIKEVYPSVIHWALNNKPAVLLLSIIPFLIAILILLPRVGQELIPEVAQGEFNVELTLPIGTPVETTADIITPIEELIMDEPEVEKISTVAGVDFTKISDSESGEHTAKITVTLVPSNNPAEAEQHVLANIRSKLRDFSGITYKISRPVLFSFKTPVEVEIKGFNLATLTTLSRQAVQTLSEVPGLTDVKSNLQRGSPEVQITYDRAKLAFYGLNILDVANLVRNKVRGDVATQFKKEERRIDIRVKVRDEDKETIDHLRRLNVNPGSEIPIYLESVAQIDIKEGPSEIRRIGQQRSAVILANIAGRSLSDVSADVYQVMRSLDIPPDFTFEITGQNKEMEVSLASLKLALLLAIFLVYIVMASQFESFIHPFVILFTIPFALIGVILILWILGIPLNIMVFLGLIMLAGIVVNNAIVLVDYINQLMRRGLPKGAGLIAHGPGIRRRRRNTHPDGHYRHCRVDQFHDIDIGGYSHGILSFSAGGKTEYGRQKSLICGK